MKLKLTPLEKSWILYDIGNSAFILMVSTLIPIYFNALAGASGVNEDLYLSYWGYAGSIATVLVAIIGPICGTLVDRKLKKPLFLLTVVLGVVGCTMLGGLVAVSAPKSHEDQSTSLLVGAGVGVTVTVGVGVITVVKPCCSSTLSPF